MTIGLDYGAGGHFPRPHAVAPCGGGAKVADADRDRFTAGGVAAGYCRLLVTPAPTGLEAISRVSLRVAIHADADAAAPRGDCQRTAKRVLPIRVLRGND